MELYPGAAIPITFANEMKTHFSLLGSWVSTPDADSSGSDTTSCVWHVIDERTCVYEQRTDMGIMTSWFQYWTTTEGILRYPLGKTTRSMFKIAEHVPIALQSEYLVMNGHRFDRASDLLIPERIDRFPGTRPDENGLPIPTNFKSKLLDYVTEPPKGEQVGDGDAEEAV